jgi:hypothetical protein
MRPWGVSAAGQKKGIFGLRRAKAGQRHAPGETVAGRSFARSFCLPKPQVSPGLIDVMSLPIAVFLVAILRAGREMQEVPITTS